MIYAGVMIHHVHMDSEHSVQLSTTENFSLSNWMHHELHWYASEVCINNLTQDQLHNLIDDKVTVSLVTKPCKHVHLKKQPRVISKSITSDSNSNTLDFYWYSNTTISFQVNITSDISERHLSVYTIHTKE